MEDSQNDSMQDATNYGGFARGSVVFEKFKVVDVLGSGGMGTVYKVEQLDLRRELALKVLNTRYTEGNAVLRFQNEAKAVSKFTHANIARIFDFGIAKDSQPYMVMELINGVTLQKLLAREPMAIGTVLYIFMDVADALEHAHQKGIIHRDIKPSNIMLEPQEEHSDRVRVLDFGLAKRTDDTADGALTRPGDVIGSPLYMSPEMAQGIPATSKSDLYSMGCVMFHCLTGKPPFRGDTALETLTMHQKAPVPNVRSEMNDPDLCVSKELAQLVEQLLAKDPDKRPASAGFVRIELLRLNQKLFDDMAKDIVVPPGVTAGGANAGGNLKVRIAFGLGILIAVFATIAFSTVVLRPAPLETLSDVVISSTHDMNVDEMEKQMGPGAPIEQAIALGGEAAVLEKRNLTDDQLKIMMGAEGKKTVSLRDNPAVTDEALKYIKHLPVKRLFLDRTSVKTLDALKEMNELNDVRLSETQITDDSLKNLKCKKLYMLSLRGTQVSYKGVKELMTRIPRLKKIEVTDTKISPQQLEKLKTEFPERKIVDFVEEPLPF